MQRLAALEEQEAGGASQGNPFTSHWAEQPANAAQARPGYGHEGHTQQPVHHMPAASLQQFSARPQANAPLYSSAKQHGDKFDMPSSQQMLPSARSVAAPVAHNPSMCSPDAPNQVTAWIACCSNSCGIQPIARDSCSRHTACNTHCSSQVCYYIPNIASA